MKTKKSRDAKLTRLSHAKYESDPEPTRPFYEAVNTMTQGHIIEKYQLG